MRPSCSAAISHFGPQSQMKRRSNRLVRLVGKACAACLFALTLVACGAGDKTKPGGGNAQTDTDAAPLNFDATLPMDAFGDGNAVDAAADALLGQELPHYDVIANCPGGPLCPCGENSDCQSGLCLEDPSVTTGKACAQPCKPGCPKGYTCANLTSGSADIQQMCVFRAARLCNPCSEDADCAVVGLADSKCVDQGHLGRFCGISCDDGANCPADYQCESVGGIAGGKFKQCVRKPDGQQAPFGICPCSPQAIAKELETPCATLVTDTSGAVVGHCQGARKCSEKGLSVCLSSPASAEVCDGVDNDCDGQTDEAGCDDGNPCTGDNCLGAKGCAHTQLDGPVCDADGSKCTPLDKCSAGVCTKGEALNCDDKNPCTIDTCEPGAGCKHSGADGLPCSDDNPCTQGDVCAGTDCKAGVAKVCNPPDGCHTAQCDLATGACKFTAAPDLTPCDDGLLCTTADVCAAGSCAGKPKNCNDGNPCTQDSCIPSTGCSFSLQGEIPCNDGDECTAGDLCVGGECIGQLMDVFAPLSAKGCNDGDPCTMDTCDPSSGCVSKLLNGATCDDGDPCTAKEQCQNGKCVASQYQCECKVDADCASKEDGNLCNGSLVCGKIAQIPACVVATQTVVQCDKTGDSACAAAACVPTTGKCVMSPAIDGAACSDGDACTAGDGCKSGKCSPGKLIDCDDDNSCTADSCDPGKGCGHTGLTGGACDADGSVCTQGDACLAGTCVKGKALACDDGNACTTDGCDAAKGCVTASAANGTPCDDANACTGSDICTAGKCGGAITCKVLSFAPPTAHTAYGAPGVCGLAVGDITGDSLVDILFEAPTGLGYFGGQANGDFPLKPTGKIGDGNVTCGARLADFDKDGQLDIVTAAPNGATVKVLLLKLVNGMPTVKAAISTSVYSKNSVREVADFDGDGHLDVVLGTDETQWQIWRNKGNQEFVQATTSLNGNVTDAAALAMELDGTPPVDLVLVVNHMVLAQGGLVSLMNASKPGAIAPFKGVSTNLGSPGFTAGCAGDFNGDGYADLVAAGIGAHILLGKGSGSFVVSSVFTVKGIEAVASGDFDADGATDFVLAGPGGNLGVYKGKGDGQFASPMAISLPVSVRLLIAADLTGDGLPDMVAADASDGRLFFLKNSSK